MPHQEAWCDRMGHILDQYHFALDVSQIGAGKSYMSLYQAQQRSLPAVVVGPPTVAVEWDTLHRENYPHSFISYNRLIGRTCYEESLLKHGLLMRHDVEKKGVITAHYRPSEAYLLQVEEGLVLIVDEIQRIKNETSSRKAIQALIQPILASERSYVIFLSGLPFDRPESFINFLKTLGVVTCKYYTRPAQIRLGSVMGTHTDKDPTIYGYDQAIAWFRSIDPDGTQAVLGPYALDRDNAIWARHITWQLFTKCGSMFTGACKVPPITVACRRYNSYYPMTKESTKLYREGESFLKTAVNEDGKIDFSTATEGLMLIERGSLPTMVQEAKQVLDANPTAKVILYVMFIESYKTLRKALKPYGVLILKGGMSIQKKSFSIREFHNNPEKRVFLVGLRVGGTGLNLQDVHGRRPRYLFMNPTYFFLDMCQAAGRTYRVGAKSDSELRVIHNKDVNIAQIISNIRQKSKVGKDTLALASLHAVLPSEYPEEHH